VRTCVYGHMQTGCSQFHVSDTGRAWHGGVVMTYSTSNSLIGCWSGGVGDQDDFANKDNDTLTSCIHCTRSFAELCSPLRISRRRSDLWEYRVGVGEIPN
jgi:hypothetical protein